MNRKAGKNSIAIQIDGLSKKYRLFDSHHHRLKEALHPFLKTYHKDFWALKDVGLEIPRGQTLGIIGSNGSGKSTLLQIISSILLPTEGTMRVEGRISPLLELGAGFNPEFTGRENAIFSGILVGQTKEEMLRRMSEIEKFADIGEYMNQPVKTYSSGMFARLAFAVSITLEPDIFIVDEVLAVGDIKFQAKCFHAFRSLQEKGVTIIFVSHSADLIIRLCHQTVVMDKGELVFSGPPKKAVDFYENLMFGDTRSVLGKNTLGDYTVAEEPGPSTLEDHNIDQIASEAVEAFLSNSSLDDRCHLRRGHIQHDIIGGNTTVQLVDYLVICGGMIDPIKLPSGTTIDLYLKYYFHQTVENPEFGIGISTIDGILVYGTNSALMGNSPRLCEAEKFYVIKYSLPLRLTAGDFLLRAGVSIQKSGQPCLLHLRRGFVHMEVTDTPHCTGLTDLECEFEIL